MISLSWEYIAEFNALQRARAVAGICLVKFKATVDTHLLFGTKLGTYEIQKYTTYTTWHGKSQLTQLGEEKAQNVARLGFKSLP